ncbi:hypothetical protein C7I55_24360 [Sphingomonas deserti]|uniref:Uncharacterized protein n=1 Tax=Allosphingosinicella deserti TaxID=2116704 RepID=A0A2P7QFU1_9SPHN|nr:hypothetical protein C7I55_24360 [Sphingomonas deserti]
MVPLSLTCTALLLLAGVSPSAAQEAPSDADFEAALRNAPPRSEARQQDGGAQGLARSPAAPASESLAAGGRGSSDRRDKVAPPGTLPAHWRGVKVLDDALWRKAQREAEQGLLDPHAFAQSVFGPLPLPPGATPIHCRNSIKRVWFTLGLDVPSAEYARALAEDERNGGKSVIGKPSFLLGHTQMAEKATIKIRADVGKHFAALGWQKVPDRTSRDIYMPAGGDPDRSLRIGVWPDAYTQQALCNYHGIKLPTGPVIEVWLPAP